ncbi:MAG TPA: hypothetical protein VFY92_01240, partial [Hyphomicrobiaceae bacterium]|nr:hypothetical protein [Hyphomicrobiaceae bacterium]
DDALWPGLSVTTRLLVSTIRNAVVVPDSAVQRGPDGLFAYVVADNGRAELRTLEVARIADGMALVEKGLAPGDRVITAGHYRVQPGAPVEVVGGAARPVTSASPAAEAAEAAPPTARGPPKTRRPRLAKPPRKSPARREARP